VHPCIAFLTLDSGASKPQGPKGQSHSFKCSDDTWFADKLEIYFAHDGESVETTNGTLTFSNSEGDCKYTNPDGEELTFKTADGKFTVGETEGDKTTLNLSWKPLGGKPVKDTVQIIYGQDGKDGVYEPQSDGEDGVEEEE
jgi:hypothetical protein